MLETTDVRVPLGAGHSMGAALALPAAMDAPAPAVLIVHEILGLNADIRRIAARFAENGYVALAPNVFEGKGPMPFCVIRTIAALRQGGGAVVDDLLAAREWLAGRDDVDGERMGVAGFCMGGGFALMLATRAPFLAVAPYYGDVPKRAEQLQGICPVVGGYGGRDRIFANQGRRLQEHLAALGVTHDVVIYPDAGHSYMSPRDSRLLEIVGGIGPMHAGYNETAAEDSWQRMFAFFERYLGSDPPPQTDD